MSIRRGFARSLRLTRKAKKLSQEDLGAVHRTAVSLLERELRGPTLETVDLLGREMQVHPLTILAIAYLPQLQKQDLDKLLKRTRAEAVEILRQSAKAGANDANRLRKNVR